MENMSAESFDETVAVPIYELRLDEGSQEVVDVPIGGPLVLRCVDLSGTSIDNDFLFWLYQGQRLAERNGITIATDDKKKVSNLKIYQLDESYVGVYECISKSGQHTLMKAKLRVRAEREITSGSLFEEDELCPPDMRDFCSNGGTCLMHKPTSTYLCRHVGTCPPEYVGKRCEYLESLVVSSKRLNEDCNSVAAERNRGIVICSLLSCILFLLIFCFLLYIKHRQVSKRPLKRDDNRGHVRSSSCSGSATLQLQPFVLRTSSVSSARQVTSQDANPNDGSALLSGNYLLLPQRPKARRLNACSD
ncbi:hypothetical protein M514_26036, partial [Trichuris suis]